MLKKYSKVAAALTLALGVVALTGCADRYESKIVDAKVIGKEYDPPEKETKTYTDSSGKKQTKTTTKSEEWEVTVEYNGIQEEFEFSDDVFYESVEVGDTVKVEYTEGLTDEGNVVSRSIDLP